MSKIIEVSDIKNVEYDIDAEEVELLDMSFFNEIYEPLDSLDDSSRAEEKFLSVYIPYKSGGLILLSDTLMSSQRGVVEEYLATVRERVYQESTEFHEITEAINKYNGLFVAVILILSLVIFWSVFDEQFKEATGFFRGMNIREVIDQFYKKTFARIPRRKDSWSSFIRKVSIVFVILLFLGILLVRVYQKRALPLSILVFLDSLNLWFDSVGFEYMFSYVLLIVLFCEVILVITLLKNIISNIRDLKVYTNITDKYNEFVGRIGFKASVEGFLKYLIPLVGIAYLLSYLLRYFGLYPTSFDYELSNKDIGSIEDHYINNKLNEDSIYIILDTIANYKEAVFNIEAELQSPSEVYLSVGNEETLSSLYYSPDFNMEFTGVTGEYRYFTSDQQKIDLSKGVGELIGDYSMLGIDRLSIENNYIPTKNSYGSLSWGDFIKTSTGLRDEPVINSEAFEHNFNGLVGQFEIYTILLGGDLSLSINYTVDNRDGEVPNLFAAIIDGENKLVGIESVDDVHPSIGKTIESSLNISRTDISPGVVRIIIGYDQKGVLLNKDIGDLDRKLYIERISLNSNKFVFRPISSRWGMMDEQSLYVMKNENNIAVNTMLQDGFNEVLLPEIESIETPEHRIGLINLSPKRGNIVNSFYSLFSLDLDSFFDPFSISITEIDSSSDVILSKDLGIMEDLTMTKPIKIGLFTSDGQRFILSQPITVSVNKK